MMQQPHDPSVFIEDVTPEAAAAPRVMPAGKFLLVTVLGFVALFLFSIVIHVGVDIYGLFRPGKDRQIRVYHDERISKYLLMHEYVPANFNTLLIGTSLSDNLDVTEYNRSGRYRIYNGSIMGGNISEVRAIAGKALEKGVKNVVFCVSPYQFKNTGAKEVELNRKIYYGALGSKNLYETYGIALIREWELMPFKFPKEHINGAGVNNFTARYRVPDVAERIRMVADVHRGKPLSVEEAALAEFRELIALFNSKDVNYVIYFHPVPVEIYQAQEAEFENFQQLVRRIIADDSKVLNLNSPEWRGFASDYSNYIDNGHLSEQGQSGVLKSVLRFFEQRYP